MKRGLKWLLVGILVAIVIAAAAPLFSADRFARRIRMALEDSLHRPVRLGDVRLNLLTGPGFTVRDVVIEEEASIGLEPIAYMTFLEARVSWRSLVTGNLQFSTLRLVEPSVNLVKYPSGGWNLRPLLASPPGAQQIPDIQVRSGRLNFRLGDTKSAFYVTNADLDFTPRADGFAFRFLGEPARTDRLAQGFGRLSGRGRWIQRAGRIDAEVQLERSNIGELMILLAGHDVGMHGLVASEATIKGNLDALDLAGRLEIGDIHRWNVQPVRGVQWPLSFRGRLDFKSERLELDTDPAAGSPVSLTLRASLSRPAWGAATTFRSMPAAPLVGLIRHLGAAIPAGLSLDGRVDGGIGYSSSGGLRGAVTLSEATLRAPDAPEISCGQADLLFDRNRVLLKPVLATFEGEETAQLQGSFFWGESSGDLDVRLDTRRLKIATLENGSARLVGAGRIPMIEHFRDGTWKGLVRYRRSVGEAGGHWTAAGDIEGARVSLPELAAPLEIRSAVIALDDTRAVVTRLRGRLAKVGVQGEYRYVAEAVRPHRFRISIPEIDAAELERMLRPLLRREQSFLSRTLGIGSPSLPEWIKSRQAEGTVEIGTLNLGESQLEKFRADVLWQGQDAELSGVEFRVGEGVARASITADFSRRSPMYRVNGAVQNLPWKGGKVDVEFFSRTSGFGPELFLNLRAEGKLTGQSLALLPDTEFRTVSGCYQFNVARGVPRLRFSSLELSIGEDVYLGSGETDAAGKLQLDMIAGSKPLRFGGSLVPLELDVLAAR